MTYAFVLDASACSGCKACQVACKDKNQLASGVLWRRVYEITGGTWRQEGAAWNNTLFAYNLSLSCNHCLHPKCAGVCPVDAYTVRADGIVLLDSSKCMGCGYCAWACPYGAPQYDKAAGRMTKCDFCTDNLSAGLAPACVSACPLRVLDFAEVQDGGTPVKGYAALWESPASLHPYPMPESSHTGPRVALKLHAGMNSAEAKRLSNREEIHTRRESGWEEVPLIVFTLLAQMAVGAVWAMLWLSGRVQLLPMLLSGACLGAGLLASFAHLGTKRNAWRALSHLRKSWLSWELFFALLFGAAWLATLTSLVLHENTTALSWLSAFIGIGLIYCMARVYHLATVPEWNTWRTNARFFLSAGVLGILGMAGLRPWIEILPVPWTAAGAIVIVLLLAETAVETSQPLSKSEGLQAGLMLASLLGCFVVFFMPGAFEIIYNFILLLVVAAWHILVRASFYQARVKR